jgi:zinc D-Ala-D-Ala carboxypeptidase
MYKNTGFALVLSSLLIFTISCEQKPKIVHPTAKVERSEPPQTTTPEVQTTDTKPTTTPSAKINEDILPDVTLKQGDKGEDVKRLQTALKKIGYTLTVDGVFGSNTATSILDLKSQIQGLDQNSIYDSNTKTAMQSILDGEIKITPGKTVTKEEKTKTNTEPVVSGDPTPDVVVTDPTSILVLVNKTHRLPDGYRPPDLVEPNVPFPFKEKLEKRLLRKVAADALEKMFTAANSSGLHLYAQSGFRSYERQKAIFTSNTKRYGSADKANQVSAFPGESEHQTGLTMDVTCPKVNFDLIEPFGTTAEGRWLKEHAHEYGFIIRYPADKVAITGYTYEPWHIRYVGVNVATDIYNRGISLEEYLGKK